MCQAASYRASMRDRRRVIEAVAVASLLSGAPSTLVSLCRHRAAVPVLADLRRATDAAATVLPPGRPGLVRGAIAHLTISAICGEVLARSLPLRHSVWWGASAGLAIGGVNLMVFGRWFPAIRALPLMPQLADNVAFGIVFALVADR